MADDFFDDQEPRGDIQIDTEEPALRVRGVFVHGQNLEQKERHRTKYRDSVSRKLLLEVRKQYNLWKEENARLEGPHLEVTRDDFEIITKRVDLLTSYKDFIDRQDIAECFDSRSNLHSSVLEEFIYFLFRDLVASFPGRPLLGKAHTFKDMFFFSAGYENMLVRPNVRVETKDHDFVIGASVASHFKCDGAGDVEEFVFEVPAVVIECKTYLDKTMLEGSSVAADQLKQRNPNALYIVVAEWLKLTININLKKFKVDQIYVFRRQKNTDREFRYAGNYEKRAFSPEVVCHLFEMVRDHLSKPWGGGVDEGLERGWLI
ncbi:Bpu10I family restriction endonuclease [Rhodomicrobium sp. Az07]|uniref:Bpu10I family restriction endonuclease n=1 Tax=Rhodomicrobium sp. Az07 TaxID=2839034 RepID=UPI001BEB288B|nr:Bpu10I family restriction endonuclease [Rhodomicrobium sp. Az07]MBT3069461.1 Bpu10I family restriction endonuclease [Rhodomicrobium sp. Az07]